MVTFRLKTLQTLGVLTVGMAPRKSKSKSPKRRRKSLTSLIDVGTSIVVANATTQAFFGTSAWEFFTAGWFGRPNATNSWRLSLNELVMGAIDPSTNYGMDMTTGGYGTSSGRMTNAIKKNIRDNGATSLATVVLAPVIAKGIKRLARKPINDINRMVLKPLAIGVKL